MKEKSGKTSFLNFFRLLFRNKCGEAFLIPMTQGKNWNNFFARIPANHYQYRPGSMREVERNGFRFVLDISDYMQWLIYFGVSIEPRDKMYALVQPGMTVMDVGANIGETALLFSRRAGANGKVYAFEPDPRTFAKLEQHIRLNNVATISALNFGLGDRSGSYLLTQSDQHSGGNRISDHGTPITIQTGDDFVATQQIKPGLIKIDVEGFELHVLKGLEKTIRNRKPVLYVEAIDDYLRAQGSSAELLVKWLINAGYQLENAFTGKAVKENDTVNGLHCDLVARPI